MWYTTLCAALTVPVSKTRLMNINDQPLEVRVHLDFRLEGMAYV